MMKKIIFILCLSIGFTSLEAKKKTKLSTAEMAYTMKIHGSYLAYLGRKVDRMEKRIKKMEKRKRNRLVRKRFSET
jgi:hypothetical protein